MICNLLEIIRVFEQWMRSTEFGKKCRTALFGFFYALIFILPANE